MRVPYTPSVRLANFAFQAKPHRPRKATADQCHGPDVPQRVRVHRAQTLDCIRPGRIMCHHRRCSRLVHHCSDRRIVQQRVLHDPASQSTRSSREGGL